MMADKLWLTLAKVSANEMVLDVSESDMLIPRRRMLACVGMPKLAIARRQQASVVCCIMMSLSRSATLSLFVSLAVNTLLKNEMHGLMCGE